MKKATKMDLEQFRKSNQHFQRYEADEAKKRLHEAVEYELED